MMLGTLSRLLGIGAVSLGLSLTARAADWPGWRGPYSNGLSDEVGLPLRWDQKTNVKWKSAVPGRGNSSPIVWRDRVFLTTLDESQRLAVVCFSAETGRVMWKTAAPKVPLGKTHEKNGYASHTPVTDGQRVFAFLGQAGVMCLDFDGKKVWRRSLGPLPCDWGTASSPVLYRDRVIVSVDFDGPSFVTALSKQDGRVLWRTPRDQPRSWGTPFLVRVGDRRELVINGAHRVMAYNPDDGRYLWTVDGMTQWVTPTPVAGHGLIYAVSGRSGPVLAIRPGGRGNVTATHVQVFAKRGAPYIPSPILLGDHLFTVNDGGIVTCFDAESGRRVWRKRIKGNFSASPVAAAGHLYCVNEAGQTYVLAAGPEFKLVGKNPIGERCLASPAIADGAIYIRGQEHLYCIKKSRGD